MQRSTPISGFLGLAIALALGALACQPPAAETEGTAEAAVDTAAIMAELDSMRTAYEEAVAAGDVDAQAAIFAPDAHYSTPGSPPVQGREAIRAAIEAGTPPGATLSIEPIETRIMSPDWLYEYGTGTFSFTPEGAEEPVEMASTYLVVFQRTTEGWRIRAESLSSEGPPPGM